MKCPLLSIAPYAMVDSTHAQFIDCLKEECAWWEKDGEDCALLLLALRLGTLVDALYLIVKKMPKDLAPGR